MRDRRVAHQRCAGIGAEAGDDVDRTGRHTCLMQPLGEQQRRERRRLGRLGDHGTTGGQRGRHAAHEGRARVIPRNDLRGDADRLALGPARQAGAERNGAAFQLVGDAGVIFEQPDAGPYVAARLGQRLARIDSLDHRKIIAALSDQRGGPVKHLAARRRRRVAPDGQPLLRRLDGARHVLALAGAEAGEGLAVAGVVALQPVAVAVGDDPAADEMPVRQARKRAFGKIGLD